MATTTTRTTDPATTVGRTPWHLWVVGALSLLWSAFGGYDWTMSHVRGDPYYREFGMTEAQIAAMHATPSWMELFWAMGVWGAVVGSVLLLLRSRWAYPVLLASLAGAVVSLLYQMAPPLGMQAIGAAGAMPFVIAFVAALLACYAWAMRRRGVLR